LFEGRGLRDDRGALRVDELRRHIEAQLHHVPRFRQRLVPVPFGLGLVWADDEHFDVAAHLHVATLSAPGGDAELRALVGRLLEEPLDPSRPLWEFWLIDGLAGDRVAVLPKVSHVMADGMALLTFSLSLLDVEPSPPSVSSTGWEPEPLPGVGPLVVTTAVERLGSQLDALWQLARTAADPRRWVGASSALWRMVTSGSGRAPGLPITRPVGHRRDFVWVRLPWSDLTQVKRAGGGTLNDVVLAITAGALARYLEHRRTPATDAVPRVLVPVSTHGENAAGEMENRFSMMVAGVPMAAEDPLDRLRAVQREMAAHKASAQTSVGPLLFAVGDLVPGWLLQAVGPMILRNQPLVNLAVTNLPGTRERLYLLDARMLELYPFVCGVGNIAVIIGVLSYEDTLGVGITVDADVVPDADHLADAIRQACTELVAAVDGAG
jgi:WS/DGAT/MGAT family acyltransferase